MNHTITHQELMFYEVQPILLAKSAKANAGFKKLELQVTISSYKRNVTHVYTVILNNELKVRSRDITVAVESYNSIIL